MHMGMLIEVTLSDVRLHMLMIPTNQDFQSKRQFVVSSSNAHLLLSSNPSYQLASSIGWLTYHQIVASYVERNNNNNQAFLCLIKFRISLGVLILFEFCSGTQLVGSSALQVPSLLQTCLLASLGFVAHTSYLVGASQHCSYHHGS